MSNFFQHCLSYIQSLKKLPSTRTQFVSVLKEFAQRYHEPFNESILLQFSVKGMTDFARDGSMSGSLFCAFSFTFSSCVLFLRCTENGFTRSFLVLSAKSRRVHHSRFVRMCLENLTNRANHRWTLLRAKMLLTCLWILNGQKRSSTTSSLYHLFL